MPYMNLIFLEDFRPHDTDLFSDLFPPQHGSGQQTAQTTRQASLTYLALTVISPA